MLVIDPIEPDAIVTGPATPEKTSRPGRPTLPLIVAAALAIAIFLYFVRSILPPFIIAGALAYVLAPVVGLIRDRGRLPHWAAVAIIVIVVLAPLFGSIVLFGPQLARETRELAVRSPAILATIIEQLAGPGPFYFFGIEAGPSTLANQLFHDIGGTITASPSKALHLATILATVVLDGLLTVIITVYLLFDGERIARAVLASARPSTRQKLQEANREIQKTVTRYLLGQLVLVAFVTFATAIALDLFFHLRFALPLALATGLFETVPFLGPVVAVTMTSTVALVQGGMPLVSEVIIFYIVLRQIEDQVVSPFVIGRAVSLHPVVVIFAVLSGGAIAGLLGTLLAVPAAAVLKVLLDNLSVELLEWWNDGDTRQR